MEDLMITFLRKFTDYPFAVKLDGQEYHIGEGDPEFTVVFKKPIPKSKLLTSTSLLWERPTWTETWKWKEICITPWTIFSPDG